LTVPPANPATPVSIVSQIDSIIEKHNMLKHPFYQAWMKGELSMEQLRNYAQQYYPHVVGFPTYVKNVRDLAPSAPALQLLDENFADETGSNGRSAPHPELWQDFGVGLGMQRGEFSAHENIQPRAQQLADVFSQLTARSYESGLAALYAYESQIPEIADAKIAGLKANYNLDCAMTNKFFDVHRTADVYHRQACRDLLAAIPEDRHAETLAATEEACTALWNFLTEAHGPNAHAC
jgi:pyrroloquinoline-quinone synthase